MAVGISKRHSKTTSETGLCALPPSCLVCIKLVICPQKQHILAAQSLFNMCHLISLINNIFLTFWNFATLPYQYYLCVILAFGVWGWCMCVCVCVCVGGGVISLSHFLVILYFSGSAHRQTHIHMRIHQSPIL